jgi:hypothetical protein
MCILDVAARLDRNERYAALRAPTLTRSAVLTMVRMSQGALCSQQVDDILFLLNRVRLRTGGLCGRCRRFRSTATATSLTPGGSDDLEDAPGVPRGPLPRLLLTCQA